MAVLAESRLGERSTTRQRCSRYQRHPERVSKALTPAKLRLLHTVADYRLVSLPQLARLWGPSEKSVQRALRSLFDMGLVEIVAVPRAALADPGQANDASLLFGSAPNIYVPTRSGLKLLHAQGLIETVQPVPTYGPQNSLFLRHELALRDVRVWLERAARGQTGQALAAWHDGQEAVLDLKRPLLPKVARPDAWFVYRLHRPQGQEVTLVGLVEVDRATERGEKRWKEKLAAYAALFAGSALQAATGYVNARVLVLCPDERRREGLAELIARHAPSSLQQRFWLAERAVMAQEGLSQSAWQQPGSQLLRPLVPAGFLHKRLGEMR